MEASYSYLRMTENPWFGTVLSSSVVSSLLALLYIFSRSQIGKCKSRTRLDGKTVIITGSSAGIGEATAYDIAARGAKVILACRNVKKTNIVKENIIKQTKNRNVSVKELDVSLLSSVRRFAEEVITTEDRLDILIHNAGVVTHDKPTTEENWNYIWATNYFGPFLLTHLLLDLMKKTKNSRIIFVSSTVHILGRIKQTQVDFFDECKTGKSGLKDSFICYCDTKLAQILFAKELARRLPSEEVTVNSLHPGTVKTHILSNARMTHTWAILYQIIGLVTRLFLKTPEEGAQTTVYLAVSEELEGVTGKYFSDCQEKRASAITDDQYLAKKLWKFSEDIVGLSTSS